MRPDFKSIIEIYNNSEDIEKLIFIDTLDDLIKGIIKKKEYKKNPHSIYIEDMTKDFVKQMNFESVKQYINLMKDLKNFIYKGTDIKGKEIGMFNVTKGTPIIPKNIKKYYHQIGEGEIEIIHELRKLLLNNFKKYGFIEIFISKNEEYNKICQEAYNSITMIDDRNRRVYLGLSNIKNSISRKYFERMEIDYGVNKIKKQIEYIFNDLELINYLCKEEDLIKLYKQITGEKIHKDYVEYNFINDSIIITYKGKEIEFEKGYMPYQILEIVLPSKKNEGIQLADLFKHINNIDFFYSKHKNELPKIRSTISGINRRFAKIYGKNEKLLSFKNQALYRIK